MDFVIFGLLSVVVKRSENEIIQEVKSTLHTRTLHNVVAENNFINWVSLFMYMYVYTTNV